MHPATSSMASTQYKVENVILRTNPVAQNAKDPSFASISKISQRGLIQLERWSKNELLSVQRTSTEIHHRHRFQKLVSPETSKFVAQTNTSPIRRNFTATTRSSATKAKGCVTERMSVAKTMERAGCRPMVVVKQRACLFLYGHSF